MKILNNFANYIQGLNKKEFDKYLTLFLLAIAALSAILTYSFYKNNSNKVTQIKSLEQLTNKSAKIISDNTKMQQEEERLQLILQQKKDFSIKTFFEQFCSTQNITAEPGWDAITQPLEGSDKFDEVILSTVIKNQTTHGMVKILDSLDKEEIIYIKELTIRNEDNKKITFDITIATKKYKRSL